MRMQFVATSLAALGLAGLAIAQTTVSRTLGIGDTAPGIDVSDWIQGDKVETFEPGHIYVLEFWATWCHPSIAGMPRLSEAQKRHAKDDVVIIGISDEPSLKVARFLRERSPFDGTLNRQRAQYTIATDPDRSVFRSYMDAAGESGIPKVFIIGREGHVEWIGHTTFMQPVLEQVVNGTWNRDVARKIRYELEPRLTAAYRSGNWQQALKIIDEMIEIDPTQAPQFEAQKFTLLLTRTDRADEAYELGARLVDRIWEDAHSLNQIAWFVVDNPDVRERNLEFAQRLADRANELTKSADAMILDTVARIHFEKGDLQTAIEWQRKAVEHLNSAVLPEFHKQITQTLTKYERMRKHP